MDTPSNIIGICATALPAEPPDWIDLMPLGVVAARDGRGPWTLDDPHAVIEASRALAMDLPIDFDHALDLGAQGAQKPAAGWIKELRVAEGAIQGRVEWTEKGVAAIRSQEHRYISPVFNFDKKTQRVMRILRAGLTNNPALYLKAVASQQTNEDKMNEFLKTIRGLFGLDDSADEAEVTKYAKTLAAAVKLQGETMQAIAEAMGLNKDAKPDAIAKAVTAAAEKATAAAKESGEGKEKKAAGSAKPDPAEFVAIAAFNEVVDQVKALTAQLAESGATEAVDKAIAEGRLVPAQRDWALEYAASNPEGFAAYAEKQPVLVKPGTEIPAAVKPKAGSDGLTPDERIVCTAMGQDPEKFLATKKANEKEAA